MDRREADLLTSVKHGPGCFAQDETGDVHAFHPSIADELKQRGIIFERDGQWCIRYEDHDIIDRMPHLAICDFCGARPVTWDVDCDTFEDADGNTSVEGWAACEPCGQAVAEGNRAWLLQRSIKHKPHWAQEMVRSNQQLFWAHFKGIKRIDKPKHFGH